MVASSRVRAAPGNYEAEVLADNPNAVWFFNETAGTTLADSSGNGLDLTANSVTLNQDGPGDLRAVLLAGAGTSFLELTPDATLLGDDLKPAHTYEMWVAPTDNSSPGGNIICNAPSDRPNRGWRVRIESGDDAPRILCRVGPASGGDDVFPEFDEPDFSPYPSGWHHLVFTFDRAGGNPRIRYYLDGQLEDTVDTADETIGPRQGEEFAIGIRTGSSPEPYEGLIGPVAVYPHALTPERIAAHYSAGVS